MHQRSMAYGQTRDGLISLMSEQADAMGQPLDDASRTKMDELSDGQIAKLYSELQERVVNSDARPIRNLSALLVSLTRGLLSGRIHAAGAGPGPQAGGRGGSDLPSLRMISGSGYNSRGTGQRSLQALAAVPRRAPSLNSPHSYTGGTRGPQATQPRYTSTVSAMLDDYGITGVDDAAVLKLEELNHDDLIGLLTEFQNVSQSGSINSPSKWLFAKARSIKVQERKNGIMTPPPRVLLANGQEIPELPGVLLDAECIEKMGELEEEEREQIIEEFQRESASTEIRNPSSWLFSKSRARIVIRVTGGRPAPKSHGLGQSLGQGHLALPHPRPSQNQAWSQPRSQSHSASNIFQIGDPYKELSEIGVDDLAIGKLKDLSAMDLQQLLVQFMQLYTTGEIQDPSKWLYAKARTIAARISQAQKAAHAHEPRMVKEEDYGATGTVPELPGVLLDEKALAKLEELGPEERDSLFAEYSIEAARKPILNPSGWVFGRARTKVVDRLTGRGRAERAERRSSPY
mmetsp:Transcript_31481/g.61815  ORF Transcript_31481/g.61815 Transcript_31481/m.61815 type:complete len:516 (+) Transcript_31481:35-1582(+)